VRILKWIVLAMLLLILVAGGLLVTIRLRMNGSLPRLEGSVSVHSIREPVTIERDGLGVVTLKATNQSDLAFATGYVHAQDRFFQMDLYRRRSAGELAELFGARMVRFDREVRLHRFRNVAEEIHARMSPEDRTILDAYVRGVNQGLAGLDAKPVEYHLLFLEPRPWSAVDSILVSLTMYVNLQEAGYELERNRGILYRSLPMALARFLDPRSTSWDAPLEGDVLQGVPVPGADIFDTRDLEVPTRARATPTDLPFQPGIAMGGSNCWALADSRTKGHGAILANDIHLDLQVPNTWYRISQSRQTETGENLVVTGITLPGLPSVVVGSNTRIAWGFTAPRIDTSDLIEIELDPEDDDRYLTPEGPRAFERYSETIGVRFGDDVTMDIRQTIWGPMIDDEPGKPLLALRWLAHDHDAVDLTNMALAEADGIDEAIEIANRCGAPAQSFIVADRSGRIGWTVLGKVPRRVGFDGSLPTSWSDGSRRWNGFLPPSEVPRIIDPPDGRLWSANQRLRSGEALSLLGFGGYDLGARAMRIRDQLETLELADEADMLALQLDDAAVFLERWRSLILDVLTPEALAADPSRTEFRDLVLRDWDGTAAPDSAGYYLVSTYRTFLSIEVLAGLTRPARQADARFSYNSFPQIEGPLWTLVSEQPEHLLNPVYETWQDQLLGPIDKITAFYARQGTPLADNTWGTRGSSGIRHPLSSAFPFLSGWLDMPETQLPGDATTPRYREQSFGVSHRMVVNPGSEEKGLFHMPCGQSGNPLSPFYRRGHEAWLEGRPTPFLPGTTEFRLNLEPEK